MKGKVEGKKKGTLKWIIIAIIAIGVIGSAMNSEKGEEPDTKIENNSGSSNDAIGTPNRLENKKPTEEFAGSTNAPDPTNAPESTPTPEATPTSETTPTPEPSPTLTPLPTNTLTPEPTPTLTPLPTNTPTPEPTPTPTPLPTNTPTPTPTPTPTIDNNQTNEQTTMVWIPRTGKKYHRSASCSGMKNPSQVSVDEAIRRGYTPCKKCY